MYNSTCCSGYTNSRIRSPISNVLYEKEDPYRRCPRPYVLVGMQCLFFSQPCDEWQMSNTWDESYANYYDAVATCRIKSNETSTKEIPGMGDLAEKILDYKMALQYCTKFAKGGCAPSLLHRQGRCYQWSPVDGSETEVPCRQWQHRMRFVCEYKRFFGKR